jgi:predicted RNA-binding protein
MYYVFSAFYNTNSQEFHGDYFLKSDTFPKKSELKEVVIINSLGNINEIVIMGITPMTEEQFTAYWNK